MAKEQILNLKFKGGDVTKAIDLSTTFGKFFYLGHEPVFHFDEEKQEVTDDVVGYDMVVLSEKTKKPYKVKMGLNADYSALSTRDEVTLIEPTSRFYQDNGALTQGATISISAEGVQKVGENKAATPKASEQPKSKES